MTAAEDRSGVIPSPQGQCDGNETLIIRDVIEQAVDRLKAAGVEGARQDAWLLLAHIRGQNRVTLLAHWRDRLGTDDRCAFQALVERRAGREPLAQIVGWKEFWSLDFRVSADVLSPRPDSECLIEAALVEVDKRARSNERALRVLDLGTGSGCLLLALLNEWPTAEGIGVDLSRAALAIARSNGERLGLAGRAEWLCANWGAAIDGTFDLIVSNPPYIAKNETTKLAPEIRRFEPEMALIAGDDGLDAYRSLAGDLCRLLAPEGVICLEVGFGQAAAVETVLEGAGLRAKKRRQDLAGVDRCLIVDQG
ncbi:MAG: peptide chain release factor N(5)-glutamine methyltransferase [Geminicoccaceae bacterium]